MNERLKEKLRRELGEENVRGNLTKWTRDWEPTADVEAIIAVVEEVMDGKMAKRVRT